MKEDAALSEINPSLQNNKWNQQIQNTTISIADYNKDGYPDLLIQFENENPWERAVWLFKNVEGDHFERVTDPFIWQTLCSPMRRQHILRRFQQRRMAGHCIHRMGRR